MCPQGNYICLGKLIYDNRIQPSESLLLRDELYIAKPNAFLIWPAY